MRLPCAVSVVLAVGLVIPAGFAAAPDPPADAEPPAAPEPPAAEETIGKPAPHWKDVSHWINLPEGKESLGPEDFRGKVLVLAFVQKSCQGSQQQMLPLIQNFASQAAGQNVPLAFVAIQTAFGQFETNSPEAVAEMAKTHKIAFPFGHAGKEGSPPQVLYRYKAKGTPWLVLIDREGVIRASRHKVAGQDLVDQINALLRGEAGPAEPSDEAPAEPAEPPPPPEPLSPAAEKLKQRLDGVRSRFEKVASEEMEIRMRIMSAQQKAMQVVKDTDEAAKKLHKGQYTRTLRAYEQMMVAIVRELRTYDAKFGSVYAALNRLRKDPAADELKADFQRVSDLIEKRRVNLLDRIGDIAVKAGRLEEAVKIYDTLRGLLPRDDKESRRSYRKKTAAAYEKFERWPDALRLYETVYKSFSPAEQKKELNLRLKLGNLYQRVGRYGKALEMYEGVKKDLPPGQKVDGLDEAIEQCKERA
jgi:tetratricopeptide (TPR) repeat protein